MNAMTSTCYGGKRSGSDAPVIPSLLGLNLFRSAGLRLFGDSQNDGKAQTGGKSQWSNGTCNGPCAPQALIETAFADER